MWYGFVYGKTSSVSGWLNIRLEPGWGLLGCVVNVWLETDLCSSLIAALYNYIEYEFIQETCGEPCSPDDSNEEVLNISLTDRESIGKVLALFEKKVVRKNINRSSSQEKSVGMFITFHYFDSDKSEPRISTMDIVTSDMIRINSSGYIVYGDGLDEDVEQFIEEVLRTRDDR